MNEDPLQYVKDINALSWRDLGYSNQLTRELPSGNNSFIGGADTDGYYEEGSFQGAQLESISANKIKTSTLEASISVGSTGPAGSYVKIDGPNNRIIVHDGTVPRIVIGNIPD